MIHDCVFLLPQCLFIHSFIHSLIFLFSQAPIPVPPQNNRMIQYNFQEEFGKCQAEQSVGFLYQSILKHCHTTMTFKNSRAYLSLIYCSDANEASSLLVDCLSHYCLDRFRRQSRMEQRSQRTKSKRMR